MDWTQIIERGETQVLDFKGACKWEGTERARLTKAIVAMANTRDGGTILIGVAEDRAGGKPKLAGLTPDQLASFDPTKLADYVNERFEPNVQLRVEKPVVDGNALAAVIVSEFSDQPHVCVQEAPYQGKLEFKPGDLLIRTAGAQSTVAGPQELRDLLARAVTKKGDHLLEQVRYIVKGVPPAAEKPDWRKTFAAELTDWDEAVREMRTKATHGGWAFSALPTDAPSSPLPHVRLTETVQAAAVSLRGWDFPYHQGKPTSNRTNRVVCETQFNAFVERWDFFRRGLFGDFRSFFEDTSFLKANETPGKELSFVSVSLSVAEFVLFSKRMFEALKYEGGVVLRVQLQGVKGRKLVSKDFFRDLRADYICAEDSILFECLSHTTELAAGWQDVAANLVEEIYALFNWSNPTNRNMILGDITKLLDRKL